MSELWSAAQLAVFARVIELNGFSAAARAYRVPKVAISRANETGCMVIVDEELAEEEKNQFNLLWGLLQAPKESTADERF